MKVSEYTLLRDTFDNAFGFMLNRLDDVYENTPDWYADQSKKDLALDRCWNEFMVALEEMGIELEDLHSRKGAQ
jgi:hypothetical protein